MLYFFLLHFSIPRSRKLPSRHLGCFFYLFYFALSFPSLLSPGAAKVPSTKQHARHVAYQNFSQSRTALPPTAAWEVIEFGLSWGRWRMCVSVWYCGGGKMNEAEIEGEWRWWRGEKNKEGEKKKDSEISQLQFPDAHMPAGQVLTWQPPLHPPAPPCMKLLRKEMRGILAESFVCLFFMLPDEEKEANWSYLEFTSFLLSHFGLLKFELWASKTGSLKGLSPQI